MIKSPRVRGIIGLLMLLVLFGIYSIGHAVFHKASSAHYAYVPQGTSLLLEIHMDEIMAQTSQDLILSTADSSLHNLILQQWKESSWSDIGSKGVDARADVLIFLYSHDHVQLTGQLLAIQNERTFRRRYLPEIDPDLQCAVISNEVAMVLSQAEKHFSKSELKKIAHDLLMGKHRRVERGDERALTVLHTFQKDEMHAGLIQFKADGNALHFSGTLNTELDLYTREMRALRPDGFNITSRISPSEIDALRSLGLPFPTEGLSAVSLNYRGIEVDMDQNPSFIPDVDLMLHFSQSCALRPFLDSLENSGSIKALQQGQFIYAGKVFYYRQFEPNEFYLGRRTPGETGPFDAEKAFFIDGDLSELTKVKASGLMGRFIEILPAYIAAQALSQNCESLTVEGKRVKGKIEVEGTLQFKENRYCTTEFLRMALLGKLLR